MYIKKSDKPRTVKLPNGEVMSRADLPDSGTKRWVASRKAKVVVAIEAGLIDVEEACDLYDLSEEELDAWSRAIRDHGIRGLQTTRLQQFRQLEVDKEGGNSTKCGKVT